MGIFERSMEQTLKIQAETIQSQHCTIRDLLLQNSILTKDLIDCIKKCCPQPKPHPIKLIYNFSSQIKNQTMADVNLTLPGPTVIGTPGLQDTVLNAPVPPPVVFHDGSVTNTDATIATATLDAASVLTITPVAPGTVTLVVTTLVDYTDSTGTAVAGASTVSDPIVVIVTAAAPVADGVKLTFSFA